MCVQNLTRKISIRRFFFSSHQRNNIYDICEPTYLNRKRFITRYLLISVNIYTLPTSCIDRTYSLF